MSRAPQASIELRNPVTGYNRSITTDNIGTFLFNNVPQSMYEIRITAPGFASVREPVEVANSAPINLSFTLKMAEVTTNVEVSASLALIDTDPSAHVDTASSAFSKLPVFDAASGLREASRHPWDMLSRPPGRTFRVKSPGPRELTQATAR